MINCIAIDDEPLALKKIEGFISQLDNLNLLGSFDNAIDALAFLREENIDLIFLDIRMKQLTGIQFLEALQQKTNIIITSAYDEYALKGYELEVSDYLLKPFSFDRFVKSVEKIAIKQKQDTVLVEDFIFIKTENRIQKVNFKDILFIKGMKEYLQIHTTKGKIMTIQTFKTFSQHLPQNDFVRVHKSFIISIDHISNIERHRIKIEDTLIPISETYRNEFYALLKNRNLLAW